MTMTAEQLAQTIRPDLEMLCSSEELTSERREALARIVEHLTPPNLLALLDELERKDKRIAKLEARHTKLRDRMAAIHNTIRLDGAGTSLSGLLSASKRAWEESAPDAGINLTVEG